MLAAIPKNAVSGFRQSGICPLNPYDMYCPSRTTDQPSGEPNSEAPVKENQSNNQTPGEQQQDTDALLEELSPKPSSSHGRPISVKRRTGDGNKELTSTPNLQDLKKKEIEK